MKKLYRSKEQRVIGGVAGGLAEYFDVDATIIRLAIAFAAANIPNVILVYIVAWIVIPETPYVQLQELTKLTREQTRPNTHSQLKNTRDKDEKVDAPTAQEILDAVSSQKPDEEQKLEGTPKVLNQETTTVQQTDSKTVSKSDRNKRALGYLLIIVGALVLLKKLAPYYWFKLPIRLLKMWWPVAVIALGLAIVFGVIKGDS